VDEKKCVREASETQDRSGVLFGGAGDQHTRDQHTQRGGEKNNPWYLVADAFVVCDEGDLSGGCDCPEGFVRVDL